MLRQLEEIQNLAVNYSREQLGRMVQMGLLDPQKAMMAGMMIQRIEQQNAQRPQTTVAQDLLGMQPPMQAPAPMQQAPMQQAPQPQAQAPQPQMPPNQGVAALPAGEVGNYAGGGIVAFDDGGKVPGFADGIPPNLFDALIEAESQWKSNRVSPKGARGLAQLMPGTARQPGYGIKPVQDESQEENLRVGREYLGAMMKKYGNVEHALAAYNWGPGNVDKWIKRGAKPEELPRETRNYIPKVKSFLAQQEAKVPPRAAAEEKLPVPDFLRRPLEAASDFLLPSAQAADTRAPIGIAAATPTASNDKSLVGSISSFFSERLPFLSGVMPQEYDTATKQRLNQIDNDRRSYSRQLYDLAGPARRSAKNPSDQKTVDELNRRIEQLDKEFLDVKFNRAKTAPVPAPVTTDRAAISKPYPANLPKPTAVDPTAGRPVTDANANPGLVRFPPEAAKTEGPTTQTPPPAATTGPAAELPPITRPSTTIPVVKYEAPAPRDLKTIASEQEEAMTRLGVNPRMYKEMIAQEEKRRGELGERKERAKGEALFEFGAGLLGARRGQEFQTASESAKAAFSNLRQTQKEVRADEEKLQDRINAFNIADDQAKRTGAKEAINQREKERDRVEAAQQDYVRSRNAANVAEAQVGATVYVAALGAKTHLDVAKLQAETYRDYTAQMRKMGLEDAQIKNVMTTAGHIYTEAMKTKPMADEATQRTVWNAALQQAMQGYAQIAPMFGGKAPAIPVMPQTTPDYQKKYGLKPIE